LNLSSDRILNDDEYGKLGFKVASTGLPLFSCETMAYLCRSIIIFFACLSLLNLLYINLIHTLPMGNVRPQKNNGESTNLHDY
jgi:hypothetical protein